MVDNITPITSLFPHHVGWLAGWLAVRTIVKERIMNAERESGRGEPYLAR